MTEQDLQFRMSTQKNYYNAGHTLSVSFRIDMLKKMYHAIRSMEDEICEALKKDLGKSRAESYMCEIGLTLEEITYMIRHVKKLAREKNVRTPLAQFASRSYIKPAPYGNVLIMSPWNYPFLLSIGPLTDAIAAGNTVILKPSAYSPASSAVIEKLISDVFPPQYVTVIQGGRKENSFLLHQKFDMIFFTGSQAVGKEVLRQAAEHLTPVILELGGKSPCIVDSTANLKLAARRIVFGKYLNCGQTCVAPDYILCEESVKDELITELKKQIRRQFGKNPLKNPNYGKIINEKHFERICSLIQPDQVVCGGQSDPSSLQIAPTVMDHVAEKDPVMSQEIFGPLLPVMTFQNIEDIPGRMAKLPKPLAFYIFSESREHINYLTERCQYGGGCINDVVIHLATTEMGFGGVGESGMGAYHGKEGFRAFTHQKSMVDKKTWMDLPMRYQPYRLIHDRLIRLFVH